MKLHLSLFYFLIFKKKIILINSPLQFINFLEYKNLYLRTESNFKSFKVIILNSSKRDISYIEEIIRFLNVKIDNIIFLKSKILIKLFVTISILIRKIFSFRIDQLIIGDYANKYFIEFYKLSHSTIFLDDGTNALDFKISRFTNKKKISIFTIFDKKIFNFKNILLNNLDLLKSKIVKQKKNKKIYILGSSGVERNFFLKDHYNFYLQYLRKRYKNCKLYYFPHPKEKKDNYKNYSYLKIIKTRLPIELHLIKNKYYPMRIIGWNSTAFILIKKLYNSKIKLSNFNLKIEKQYLTRHYLEYVQERVLKIIDYFNKYLKIKTIYIIHKKND